MDGPATDFEIIVIGGFVIGGVCVAFLLEMIADLKRRVRRLEEGEGDGDL